MPESDVSTMVILLACCGGLLVVLLLLVFRVSGRLSRIEAQLGRIQIPSDPVDPGPSVAETSAGGAFETFLNEDPARRDLPKGEQFSAYRKWRQEKGMNWSNS